MAGIPRRLTKTDDYIIKMILVTEKPITTEILNLSEVLANSK